MFKTSPEDVSKGITERLINLKGTDTESGFAQRCEVPISTMRKYLAGSMPGADKLVLIAMANGVSVEWLATGAAPKSAGSASDCISCDKVEIPILDVQVSAGHGAASSVESVLGTLAFQRQYLAGRQLQPENLRVVYAKGDSMEPEIQDGAAMLVNTGDTTMDEGCIYVIRLNDHLFAKRVQRSMDGAVNLISANPMYKPQEVKPSQLQDLVVVGRVVWSGREH